MKKVVGVFATVIIILSLIAFQKKSKNAIEQVTNNYISRLNSFKTELSKIVLLCESGQAYKKKIIEIKDVYLQARKNFKEWEYLACIKDPVLLRKEINPAPLPKTEENSFGANIIEPRGLQVLDEAVFSNEVDLNEIKKQVKYLLNILGEYTPGKIYDRDVFEGARVQLIRIFTLGLTGFDTPGSVNGVNDAIVSLQAIQQDFNNYNESIRIKDKFLSDSINNKFTETINYLHFNNNFNKLNRAVVLKKYLNPLYRLILLAHKALQIELPHEVYLAPRAYNYNSTNIFNDDLLNQSYYSKIPDKFNNDRTIELGRILFYDPIMSSGIDRSCASCHSPEKGFTDHLPKSIATGRKGTLLRNSPTLINALYSERLFHDMRARTFADQMEHVLTTPEEFNSDMMELISKLNKSEEYKTLFKKTFGDSIDPIKPVYIQFALSAFVSSLVGFNSEFDKYIRDETRSISASVVNGFNLFMGKAVCGTCHFAPVFNGTVPPDYTETESEVLGVPENPYIKKPVIDSDEGRGQALLKEKVYYNKYAFKTPTVRNAELTQPYMHNGSYKTLEDVVDFYNKGGGKGISILVEHQTLPFDKLNLTKKEMGDIVAFMKSLTDTSGLCRKPLRLPSFERQMDWNNRKIGGEY